MFARVWIVCVPQLSVCESLCFFFLFSFFFYCTMVFRFDVRVLLYVCICLRGFVCTRRTRVCQRVIVYILAVVAAWARKQTILPSVLHLTFHLLGWEYMRDNVQVWYGGGGCTCTHNFRSHFPIYGDGGGIWRRLVSCEKRQHKFARQNELILRAVVYGRRISSHGWESYKFMRMENSIFPLINFSFWSVYLLNTIF